MEEEKSVFNVIFFVVCMDRLSSPSKTHVNNQQIFGSRLILILFPCQ